MGRLKRKWVIWPAAAVVALAVAGAVSFQIALLWIHPITDGGISWAPYGNCSDFNHQGTTVDCAEAPFDPGAPVAIGWSVRNAGPVSLTIAAAEDLRVPSEHTIAKLHAVFPWKGDLFSLNETQTRPFESITLAPGQQADIEFLGNFQSCEAVQGYAGPGTAVIFDRVRLTVRWLLFSRQVEVPMRRVLKVDAPAEGQCA